MARRTLSGLASAADAWSGDVVGPGVDGKVLQDVAVVLAQLGLLLGLLERIIVTIDIVVDDALADGRDVEDAVEQVSGPEGVELGAGDSVAKTAHGVKATANLEGEITDDGLGGGIGSTPVASPAYK